MNARHILRKVLAISLLSFLPAAAFACSGQDTPPFRKGLPPIGPFGPSGRETFADYLVPDMPAAVHYFSTRPIEVGSTAEIAVVIVHGWGDGVELPAEGPSFHEAAFRRLGNVEKIPYVVLPVFPTAKTMEKFKLRDDGRARWCDSKIGRKDDWCSPTDDWRGGGDADNARVSSFEVVDRFFAAFADKAKYPNLKRVVLTGFSAGGQFSGRYAAVGKGIVREGVTVDYAPMSPSTWLRLDEEDEWLYGLKDRPRYCAALTREQILSNLASRRQWNACGLKDVKQRPFTSLDSTPVAMRQGPNRYARFRSFEDYVKTFPKWAAKSSFHTFEKLGHEYKKAYADPALVDFLVGRASTVP